MRGRRTARRRAWSATGGRCPATIPEDETYPEADSQDPGGANNLRKNGSAKQPHIGFGPAKSYADDRTEQHCDQHRPDYNGGRILKQTEPGDQRRSRVHRQVGSGQGWSRMSPLHALPCAARR